MIITEEFLEANRTERGSWNNSQLALLEVGWPPIKGWKKYVIGQDFPEHILSLFVAYGKERPRGEVKKSMREKGKQDYLKIHCKTGKKKRAKESYIRKCGPVTIRKPGIEDRAYFPPETDAFLTTYEWRRARMSALKKYGARCQCCGATPADGLRMHVDHIKPRKLFPHLALNTDNLQVLCEVCNHGKGNWDMTDWRPAEKESIDEEQLAHLKSI
jgi:5-methylcytosine-specific restriction endonuclease McrA